jgi:hypothetical protein
MRNIASYFTPTKRLARQFRKLTPYEIDALVINALQDDPTKQVHYILLSDSSMNHPHEILTKEQITLAVDECYEKIRTNKLMQNYDDIFVFAVIEGIVWRLIWGEQISGKDIEHGMGQLLGLASRTIKGEACLECRETEYKSPNRLDELEDMEHDYFVDKIEELVAGAKRIGLEWSLDRRAKFSLNKLCAVYDQYRPLQYLAQNPDDGEALVDPTYETMWCHWGEDNGDAYRRSCKCWDINIGAHMKHCHMSPED